MARKTVVELVDDLDPTQSADVTREFTINGVDYALDLSAEHAQQFDDTLSAWTAVARRVGGRAKRGTGQSRNDSGREVARRVREWAAQNGIEVSPRGRLPRRLVEQYEMSTKRELVTS